MEKKITFIDLFAGAGGFGLGLRMAKLIPLLSVEIDRFAAATLAYNSCHNILQKDLSLVSNKHLISKFIENKVDIIIGGPPCQGFSNAAGKKVNSFDNRNKLVFSFIKWVEHLTPKVFVIENVPGIETKIDLDGSNIFEKICSQAYEIGYSINLWKLNAADYGVPQLRRRVFIVGIRGQNSKLVAPKATHGGFSADGVNVNSLLPYITVGDAILDLPLIKAKEGGEVLGYEEGIVDLSEYQKWARIGSKFVFNHAAMHHTDRMIKRYEHFINGNIDLPDELRVRERNGNGKLSSSQFKSNYRYLNPEKPSYTIPASFYSSFVHPFIARNLTTREAARIQSFPDWYKFEGKRTLISNKLLEKQGKFDEIGLSQYNQVGNAVPPLLAKAVGDHIRDSLF